MIPTMRNGPQVGLCIGKTDNYFSEKGFDFRPATMISHSTKRTPYCEKISEKKFDFRPATLATEQTPF